MVTINKFFKYIFVAIISIILALYFMLKFEVVQRNIIKYLNNTVLQQEGLHLAIDGFSFAFRNNLACDFKNLELEDKNGLFLKIVDAQIEVNLFQLLFNNISINRFRSENIELLREPVLRKSEKSASTFNIIIFDTNIEQLVLGSQLTNGYQIHAKVEGSFKLLGKKRQVHLKINSIADGKQFNIDDTIFLTLNTQANLANESVNIQQLDVKFGQSKLQAKLNLDKKKNLAKGNVSYSSNILDKLFGNDVIRGRIKESQISGKLNIKGTLDNIKIKNSTVIDASLSEKNRINFPKMQLEMLGYIKPDGSSFDFDLRQGIFASNGIIHQSRDNFAIRNFTIKSANTRSRINVNFNKDTKIINGDIDLDFKNIKDLSQYFDEIYSGKIRSKGKFRMEGEKLWAEFAGDFDEIKTSKVTVGKGQINLSAEDLLKLNIKKLMIQFEHILAGRTNIREFKMDGKSKFQNNRHIFASENTLNISQPFYTKISYSHELDLADSYSQISNLSGTANGHNVASKSPIIAKFSKGLVLDPFTIDIANGEIKSFGEFDSNNLFLSCNLINIPFSIIPLVENKPLKNSVINGGLEFKQINNKPTISATLEVGNIDLPKKTKGSTAQLYLQANAKSIILEGSIKQIDKHSQKDIAILQGTAPIKLNLFPVSFEFQRNLPISGNFEMIKKFPILTLIPTPLGHKFKGEIEGKIDITGSINRPKFIGQLDVIEGSYKYKRYGIILQNINTQINFTDDMIKLQNFTLDDYKGNKALLTARIKINNNLPYRLTLDTEKFNLIDSAFARGSLKGKLSFTGNKDKGFVKGDIVAGPFDIKIPTRFSNNVSTLNVTQTIAKDQIISDRQSQKESKYKVDMKVNIKTNNRVFVKGWGVNTQLAGDVRIRGDINSPEFIGTLVSKHGKFKNFGKTLNITKGELVFDGPIPPSPYLNIVGSTKVDAYEIQLILSGSINSPQLQVASTPELGREEAMSMLLVGKNTDNLSIWQAAQIVNGMSKLSSKNSGTTTFDNIFEKATDAFGLDEIIIKPDEEDPYNTFVGASKQLTDQIFIEVGAAQENVKAKVEVELTPTLNLEGNAEKGGASVGIKYKYDY